MSTILPDSGPSITLRTPDGAPRPIRVNGFTDSAGNWYEVDDFCGHLHGTPFALQGGEGSAVLVRLDVDGNGYGIVTLDASPRRSDLDTLAEAVELLTATRDQLAALTPGATR